MSHTLIGRLSGQLCEECQEPLAHMTVRLYRAAADGPTTALAVAPTKHTFQLLDEAAVDAKRPRLLGEFPTDAQGRFEAHLDAQTGYHGEAIEIDVHADAVPGLPPGGEPPEPLRMSLTVLQPQWRRDGQAATAAWQETLPQRLWCWLRARQGVWTICGQVLDCDSGQPVAGVKVSAFDRDWLQDDPLGFAHTDAQGHYRIHYRDVDFRRDVLGFNLELVGGPDVYFKIETPSGTSLLNEPPSRARAADRENIGPCFCARLCVKAPPPVRHAWFTRVGDFGIHSDINGLTDGLTRHAVPQGFPNAHGGPGWAFHGALKLVGDVPAFHPAGGAPMRYRFLVEVLGGGGGLQPVTAAQIVATKIGSRPILWNVAGTAAPVLTAQDIILAPSGGVPGAVASPTPAPALPPNVAWGPIPPAIVVPNADGWVAVDPSATNGGLSGPLLRLDSTTVVPGGLPPTGNAGAAPPSPRSGATLRIAFEAEPTTGANAANPRLGNTLERLRVNNWAQVHQLQLQQFSAPGATPCSGLNNALDVMYTVDHELIADWQVGLTTAAALPPIVPPLPSGSTPRGDAGIHHLGISAWPACSYALTLGSRRKLTDGETDDPGISSMVTFCKRAMDEDCDDGALPPAA